MKCIELLLLLEWMGISFTWQCWESHLPASLLASLTLSITRGSAALSWIQLCWLCSALLQGNILSNAAPSHSPTSDAPQTKGRFCTASTHPPIHKLISAPLQDEILCSCPSTISNALLTIPLASIQYPAAKASSPAKPGSLQDGVSLGPVCVGRERGKLGLDALATKAHMVQGPVLLSFQQCAGARTSYMQYESHPWLESPVLGSM